MFLAFFLTGVLSQTSLERFTFERVEMAVPVRLVLYAQDAEQANRAANAAFQRFHDLNIRLSDYNEESEIRRFCDRALPRRFIRVSPDLWNVLRQAVHFAEETDGAFDPTVGQVVRLWRQARHSRRFPTSEKIEKALATVDWQNLLFNEDDRSIALERTGAKNNVRIDLGAIAKGYAVDEALRAMRCAGVSCAMVDAGGDIGLGDAPPGKNGWKIAITPLEKDAEPTEFLELKNCGVANSGDLYQFVEMDGKRYSHIVNPKTGIGLTNRLMVSVIAPTATAADALASAFSVLGEEKALEKAETLPGVETQILKILPNGQGKSTFSTGFRTWKE